VDCDLHLLEPLELWDRIEEPYRSRTKVTPAPGGYASAPGRITEIGGFASTAGAAFLRRQSLDRLAKEPLIEKPFRSSDPAIWLEAMDIEGIDVAVLVPTTAAMSNLAEDPNHALAICRAYNDWAAEFSASAPERFRFWGWLPRQAPELAAREADRCVKQLAAAGVAIVAAQLEGRALSEPLFEPLWVALDALDVPLGLHVGAGRAGRAEMHRVREGREIPLSTRTLHDSMDCVAELIFGGVLDRFPNVRPLIMELGVSWLLWYRWRLDAQWEMYQPFVDYDLLMKPSDYLRRRFHFSADPSEDSLRYLIADGFEDSLLISTDYPHHDSEFPHAIETFLSLPGIPEAVQRKILWDNSARFFALKSQEKPHA
jgi:predicted TIM-barrel fold metal-dependent hydrolase